MACLLLIGSLDLRWKTTKHSDNNEVSLHHNEFNIDLQISHLMYNTKVIQHQSNSDHHFHELYSKQFYQLGSKSTQQKCKVWSTLRLHTISTICNTNKTYTYPSIKSTILKTVLKSFEFFTKEWILKINFKVILLQVLCFKICYFCNRWNNF